jgi:hypothetical protein
LRGEREDAERTPHRERERNGEFYSKLADSIRAPDYLLLALLDKASRNIFLLLSFRLSWAGLPSPAIDCREESSYFAQEKPGRPSFSMEPAGRQREDFMAWKRFSFYLSVKSCAPPPVNVVIACLLPQLLFVAALTAHTYRGKH